MRESRVNCSPGASLEPSRSEGRTALFLYQNPYEGASRVITMEDIRTRISIMVRGWGRSNCRGEAVGDGGYRGYATEPFREGSLLGLRDSRATMKELKIQILSGKTIKYQDCARRGGLRAILGVFEG